MAVAVSMIIIWLFFGDLKASLIVGTSIPISILTALVAMSAAGFSLNVITLSSLVLGVGMMVDNSIVVLESCFRSTKGVGFREYSKAALEGSGIVLESIIGGTITTCVVFIPLALLEGMSGQMFKPLGFTIVFCMLASLISAMTIVPLCYTKRKRCGAVIQTGRNAAEWIPQIDEGASSEEENRYHDLCCPADPVLCAGRSAGL